MLRIFKALWRSLERLPLHPVFIVLNLVLLFSAGEVSGIEVSTMLHAAGVFLAATAILIALLTPSLGLNRAAIGASVILILAIPVPAVLGTPETIGATGRLAVLMVIPLLIVGTVIGLHRPEGRAPLTLIFNLVSLALLVQSAVPPVSKSIDLAGRPSPAQLYPDLPAAAPNEAAPDVWHIVMDRYAGGEVLKQVYGFDNAPFLEALDQRGFSVARAAAANYQRTAQSLTSTLNLDYLTPFEESGRVAGDDLLPLYRALQDNRVSRFFAAEGYAVIHAGPWWEPTRHDANETVSLDYADQPELMRVMLDRSLLGYIAVATGVEFANGRLTQCNRTLAQFDRLEQTAASSERKFVFAHILLPHPPFVFDAEGACKDGAVAARMTRVENYVDQVRYANRRLLALLDRIMAGPRPAVILLQADEGPWPEAFAGNELDIGMDATHIDWRELSGEQLREKMLILYGLRYPDAPAAGIGDHATPVNAYRMILNRYFSGSYEILPERSYVFRDRQNLYDFIDVTKALQ